MGIDDVSLEIGQLKALSIERKAQGDAMFKMLQEIRDDMVKRDEFGKYTTITDTRLTFCEESSRDWRSKKGFVVALAGFITVIGIPNVWNFLKNLHN